MVGWCWGGDSDSAIVCDILDHDAPQAVVPAGFFISFPEVCLVFLKDVFF